MAFVFSTSVSIPKKTIKGILNEFKQNIIMTLEKSSTIEQHTLDYIQCVVDEEIFNITETPSISTICGYTLTNDDVLSIRKFLRSGQTINAIKLFKSVTNAPLRESKEFIEKYKTLIDTV